jgi:hypothetical protein
MDKMVYIEWMDIVADPDAGWKNPLDTSDFFARKDNLVKEIGFLCGEDKKNIYLVSRFMPSDIAFLTGSRTIIPKSCIVKRKLLKM